MIESGILPAARAKPIYAVAASRADAPRERGRAGCRERSVVRPSICLRARLPPPAARRRPVWRGRSQPAGSTLWLARARLQKQRRWVSPPGSAPHLGGEAARGQRAGRERSAHLLPSRRRAQRGETLHARKARHPPTGFWPKEASVKPVTGSARPDATARGAGGGGGASPEERVRIEGPERRPGRRGGRRGSSLRAPFSEGRFGLRLVGRPRGGGEVFA